MNTALDSVTFTDLPVGFRIANQCEEGRVSCAIHIPNMYPVYKYSGMRKIKKRLGYTTSIHILRSATSGRSLWAPCVVKVDSPATARYNNFRFRNVYRRNRY